MGSVHPFKRPPKNRGQFRGQKPRPEALAQRRSKRRWSWGYKQAMLATLGVSVGALIGLSAFRLVSGEADAATFACSAPEVLDGDTLDCGQQRVRLQGIDAPELAGHCRPGRKCAPGDPYASTENLRQLVAGSTLQCRQTDTDVYGRTVARCSVGETDLSCAQIDGGYAIKRYALIIC